MLVTVSLISNTQGVSTPLGRLNPGDAPISQVVRPQRIESVAADLAYLEAQGLISFSVAEDPATDDRFQVMTRTAESNSNAGGVGGAASGTEYQGEDITFYIPLPAAGGSASEIVISAPGKLPKLRILDWFVTTATLSASCSAQLFDTTGGVGALSSAIAMTATGLVRHTPTGTFTLGMKAASKGLYLRRSTNSNGVGEAVIWARAEY
jgi:hypothetical protein